MVCFNILLLCMYKATKQTLRYKPQFHGVFMESHNPKQGISFSTARSLIVFHHKKRPKESIQWQTQRHFGVNAFEL
jgi:hypothetical protein